jgi:multidrug efflux pump
VQAESPYRLHPEDIARLKTRNAAGEMIPLGSVVKVQPTFGPDRVMHYNGFPAAEINGAPALGFSSGQGEGAMSSLLNDQLPNGMKFEWTELTYQKILAGNTMVYIFPLSVFLVYLVLAAQYESWTLPLVVILIVPMTLFSAIAGVWITHGDNNVFTQISLIVLVGLACKNAILIVEFARERQLEGVGAVDAVLEACRLRLRPILMSVIPLVLSSGAGSEMRQAIGIAVFFGMLGVTVFGLVLTPVFYVVIQKLVEKRQSKKSVETRELSPAA